MKINLLIGINAKKMTNVLEKKNIHAWHKNPFELN
jgi:hypothetical protein